MSGKLYVLDLNLNPDINPASELIRQIASRELNYSDVINKILNSSLPV